MQWIHSRAALVSSGKNMVIFCHLISREITEKSVIDSLEFADRFMMDTVIKKAFAVLTQLGCPTYFLERALILADRVSSKAEIIV